MIIYDLPGHLQYISNRSACMYMQAKSINNSPTTFILLQDVTKDSAAITKELYYWSAMIEDACYKCPHQSSVIVLGTHADLLSVEEQTIKLTHLKSAAKLAIRNQILVDVLILNLKKTYSRKLSHFMGLLHQTNNAVIRDGSSISLMCPVLYAFLKTKLPDPSIDAITLSDLLECLTADQDSLIAPDISQIIPLLEALSEKGLIFFISSLDPHKSWIVLQIESILMKVNHFLFLDPPPNEHVQLPIGRNIGIISKAELKEMFPEYDAEMIVEVMIQFQLCQTLDLCNVNAKITPDGFLCSERGSLLFFPALIRDGRPSNAVASDNSFVWSMDTKFPYQFFSTYFFYVLLRRLVFEFMVPSLQTTHLHSYLSCCSEVWSLGMRWHSESAGVTTIVEMSDTLQSISLAVSSHDRTDPKYLQLLHAVHSVVKKAYQEFCPHTEVVELISCPSAVNSDHPRVELPSLKKALHGQEKYIVTDQKHIILCEWLKMEPCLPYIIDSKNKMVFMKLFMFFFLIYFPAFISAIDPKHTALEGRE